MTRVPQQGPQQDETGRRIEQHLSAVKDSPDWADLAEIIDWYKRDVGVLLAERRGLQERIKFTADYESLKLAALSASRIDPPVPSQGGDECMSSPTREHAFSEHEGARTRIGTGKACVWCGVHESAIAAAVVPSPSAPERLIDNWTDEEIAAERVSFEAFARRRNLSPEVFAMVCPWAVSSSSVADPCLKTPLKQESDPCLKAVSSVADSPTKWTAEQEVEAVKQQLPFGAWKLGASLARCVEDLRMDRDMYRGTLVGLLPVCDATPGPLADAVKRFVGQVIRPSASSASAEAETQKKNTTI